MTTLATAPQAPATTANVHDRPAGPADGSTPARPPVRDGLRAIVPICLGVAPMAVALGALVGGSDLDPVAALSSSVLVMAGSAQLTLLDMSIRDLDALVIVATALLINARFLAYSAAMASWFPTSSRWQRALLALPLVDQMFLVTANDRARVRRTEAERRRFYAAAAAALVTVWVVAQVAGYLFGALLPEAFALQAATPLCLSGLLAVSLKDRRAWGAAAAGGAATALLALALGPAAILLGIAVAVVLVPAGSAS
ncbi:AzlC family ABC transporter permease [Nocardioides sp. YIM 152588]|uniref:AzlC family ABC transporter permease n=1 Tax=Nocardioides sp. YIM 152588 TaxID=3158259 RepID=UPI0032E4196A